MFVAPVARSQQDLEIWKLQEALGLADGYSRFGNLNERGPDQFAGICEGPGIFPRPWSLELVANRCTHSLRVQIDLPVLPIVRRTAIQVQHLITIVIVDVLGSKEKVFGSCVF